MGERLFRFKQFAVVHERSAMKVGVDGVLLGAWAKVDASTRRILDAGSGCGVIALMMAQRAPEADITAIDIDRPSAEEAARNFENSRWKDRLEAVEADYVDFANSQAEGTFDLIVSNPPYYDAGVDAGESGRMRSRHCGDFGPLPLLRYGERMLAEHGRIALIVPADGLESLSDEARKKGLHCFRFCRVSGVKGKAPKRILAEYGREKSVLTEEAELAIRLASGEYTDEYRSLTRDFYLNF